MCELPTGWEVSSIIKAPPRKPPEKPTTDAQVRNLQTKEVRERMKRANGFAAALANWLDKYARMRERQITRRLQSRGLRAGLEIAKARTTFDSLERELRELYMTFGLQQVEDSGARWAANLGGTFIVRPQVKERYARSIENKVVLLFENTEQMVRDSLQTIIIDALGESPRPTAREVGRRIARQWHGPRAKVGEEIGRGTAAERRAIADWRRRQRDPSLPPGPGVFLDPSLIEEGEREALFSPARAAAIARTELGDADTAGALEGFAAVGVEKAGWLASPNDGRSGKRMHYKMNDHPAIPVADLVKSNRSRWFKLPSGARARRPLDPLLPVGERVNCRCALTPRR